MYIAVGGRVVYIYNIGSYVYIVYIYIILVAMYIAVGGRVVYIYIYIYI